MGMNVVLKKGNELMELKKGNNRDEDHECAVKGFLWSLKVHKV